MEKIKRTIRRGRTRISSKHQATIPAEAMRRAGLKAGDELRMEDASPGRVVLARVEDMLAKHAGKAIGVYPPGYLDELRNEWH